MDQFLSWFQRVVKVYLFHLFHLEYVVSHHMRCKTIFWILLPLLCLILSDVAKSEILPWRCGLHRDFANQNRWSRKHQAWMKSSAQTRYTNFHLVWRHANPYFHGFIAHRVWSANFLALSLVFQPNKHRKIIQCSPSDIYAGLESQFSHW